MKFKKYHPDNKSKKLCEMVEYLKRHGKMFLKLKNEIYELVFEKWSKRYL